MIQGRTVLGRKRPQVGMFDGRQLEVTMRCAVVHMPEQEDGNTRAVTLRRPLR